MQVQTQRAEVTLDLGPKRGGRLLAGSSRKGVLAEGDT